MKRFLVLACLICATVGELSAIPAKRLIRSICQNDGTVLFIQLCGDENFHYYITSDGIPVKQAADGFYYYAVWAGDSLQAGTMLAHDEKNRSMEERSFLNGKGGEVKHNIHTAWRQRSVQRNRLRTNRMAARSRNTRNVNGRTAIIGEKKGLVILVNFSDITHSSAAPQQTFNAMMNEVGYKGNGQYGSVHDYFYAQSYGQFSLNFDVVGPVTLSHNMAYYGADSGGEGNDIRPGQMVAEACKLADSRVNFADYDWDGDGTVEQVYVIYAGYGQASGASANTIWPHEWELRSSDYGQVLQLDGVTINTYACGSELSGTSGKVIDGIGTTCHEFSHCMGLPDFYDTEGSGNFGMDCWSLMDYGCYNDNGNTPAGYTSYERMYCGWLEPIVLDAPCQIAGMKAISESKEAYIIYNDANKDEYYLLENRQQTGWDSEGNGHGMLVLHVDYDPTVWMYNEVNNTASHQRMTIIPADNSLASSLSSLAGDPFPGRTGNKQLTDTSTPAATLYNLNADRRKFMGKPIENITETNGLISFDFMGGVVVPVPEVMAPVYDTNVGGFTAYWKAVEGAESYTLQLTAYAPGESQPQTVLTDDFSRFVTASLGTVDIASKLNEYTTAPGWTGYKVFTSSRGVKLGTANAQGYLTTPLLDAVAGTDITVKVEALSYAVSTPTTLSVQLADASGNIIQEQECTASTEQAMTYEFTFKGIPGNYKIRLAPRARIYLSSFAVEAGQAATVTEISGIKENHYAFTDLAGTLFSYRVRTVVGGNQSAWSESMSVDLATGIDETVSENAWLPGDDVEVYTLGGIQVKRVPFARWRNGLPRGVYIVKGAKASRKMQVE